MRQLMLLVASVTLSLIAAGAPDLFVATAGVGHVTPAAAYPFGMVQAGPDTSAKPEQFVGDWAHTCGYQFGDNYLWRFSQNRFYGTGCGSLGMIGLLPVIGEQPLGTPKSVKMDKTTEAAEPGYYTVTLTNGIRCEISVLAHTAAYRFTFPAGADARIVVDSDWGIWPNRRADSSFGRVVFDGAVKLRADTEALVHSRQLSWNEIEAWADICFSAPVKTRRLLNQPTAKVGEIWEFGFGPLPGGVLELRLGLSRNSILGAERNLAAEMPRCDFEAVRGKSAAEWRRRLACLTLEGEVSKSVRTLFESAYYRTLIHPNDIGDVGTRFFTNLSLWDVFRSCSPLQTVVAPEVTAELADSMTRVYERQGYLPIFQVWGNENHCMIGHHAVPIIVDAYLKGLLKGRDVEQMYAAVKDSLTRLHVKVNNGTWGLMKEDWDLLDKYGYYPFDLLNQPDRESYEQMRVKGESVSRLLECAYDDACAARFAAALGKTEDAQFFTRRAGYWRNVFDKSVGFVRGKDSQGRWREPFDPKCCGAGPWAENDFTEGNSWQYTWHVMQDIPGLVEAMGGKEKFGAKLEALFKEGSEVYGTSFTHDVSGLIGQYAHGNEPSHHVAYLFRFSDRPEKTDEYVGRICAELYQPTPDGNCGNDDSGAMAAWYVWSVMGLYPVDPCGGEYVLGCPQAPGATIRLPNGKVFRVATRGFRPRGRIVSATLNGRPVTGWKIRHADLIAGGELVFFY